MFFGKSFQQPFIDNMELAVSFVFRVVSGAACVFFTMNLKALGKNWLLLADNEPGSVVISPPAVSEKPFFVPVEIVYGLDRVYASQGGHRRPPGHPDHVPVITSSVVEGASPCPSGSWWRRGFSRPAEISLGTSTWHSITSKHVFSDSWRHDFVMQLIWRVQTRWRSVSSPMNSKSETGA